MERFRNFTGAPGLAAAIALALFCGLGPRRASADGDAQRGAVLFALAGGCGCHTPDRGPVGAGGRKIVTPLGTFYGTNITPDPGTGIGEWSDDEIVAAIREGVLRHGETEAPVMPYPLYAGMADEDARDLVAYLRTLPAVSNEVPAAEVRIPFPRLAYEAWRRLFVRPAYPPSEAPQKGVERGRYLVEHVAICGDCHTGRNSFGALLRDLHLAGTAHGPDGHSVPNMTPDPETGAGGWDVSDLTQLLQTGMKPDFDNVQGPMADVIDGVGGGPGYAKAPESDLRAMAVYLKTVHPIRHRVEAHRSR